MNVVGAAGGAVAAVVVALSDDALATTVVDALSSPDFDVTTVAGIAGAAGLAPGDGPFVMIVDDGAESWLRDVSDLSVARPNARFLALVDVGSSAELLAAVTAGVAGFVSPTAGHDALARTVRAMIDIGVAIPRDLVVDLVEELRRSGRGRSVTTARGPIDVTDREWEILQLLLQRRSTREMAEMLFVSVGTVRSHVSALGRKLGAADREDTIRLLGRRHG